MPTIVQDVEHAGVELPLAALRCPRSGGKLAWRDGGLVSENGDHRYENEGPIPDLRAAPTSLHIELPWYEPWSDLDSIPFEFPTPIEGAELPFHVDKYLAGAIGPTGDGRSIVEVGCGERGCERYFQARGFDYLATDVEVRGPGPHILADAHNLPLADNAFDIYLSTAVYQHLTCPLRALQEAFRVLRPKGMFCTTSVLVYGFHDHASFNHMTHAAWLWMLRSVGFTDIRIWPDWYYYQSIPEMAFGVRGPGTPWRLATGAFLRVMDWTFTAASRTIRRVVGKSELDRQRRNVHNAGSLTIVACKPAD